jgi:hypothetical protein
MKKLLFLLLLLIIPKQLVAQCPENYVCIDKSTYKQIYDKLEILAVIEESQPQMKFKDPIVILTDEKGRIFSNSTGEKPIIGSLEWGSLKTDFQMTIDLNVKRKETPIWGLRFRPKFSGSWILFNTYTKDALDFGCDLDFLYYQKINLNAYVGARSTGLDIGYDVFTNSGILIGFKWIWFTSEFSPSVGWYFTF